MQSSSKKIQVFLLGRDNLNWSIDSDRKNTANLFTNDYNFKLTQNIFKADIIYSVWYDILERPWYFYPILLLKKIKKIKVFAVITNRIENTPEKITKLKHIINIWISPNTKTHNFIQDKNLNSIQIPFLINEKIFYKTNKTKKELSKILNIDYAKLQDKLLIGSFQRDSLGTDLSKPKWQKDPELLITILKNLPLDKFILILAGPRRHFLINKCKELNIPYLFIGNEQYITNNIDDIKENNLSLNKINLLYGLIDVYLVTSKSEGGPKAILEAATTETLIFSTDVGLASDILHSKFIYKKNNLIPILNNLILLLNNKNTFEKEKLYNKNKYLTITDRTKIISTIKKAYSQIAK